MPGMARIFQEIDASPLDFFPQHHPSQHHPTIVLWSSPRKAMIPMEVGGPART